MSLVRNNWNYKLHPIAGYSSGHGPRLIEDSGYKIWGGSVQMRQGGPCSIEPDGIKNWSTQLD